MLRTLSSQPIINTRWLQVNQQRVQTPSGQIFDDYYVARKADFAMVVALTPDNEVVMVREWKHGVKSYVWNLPAGGIGENETPRQAIERELVEETGYTAEEFHLLGNHFHVSSSWLEDRAYLFRATNARKVAEPRLEDTEDIEVHLVPFDDVVEMVRNGQITDPYTALAVLWVAEKKLNE
jgi:8-oxo-dGTP pyrophosphatase MutT (NUDIX family)